MTIHSFEEENQKTKKIIKIKQFLQSNGIQRTKKKIFAFCQNVDPIRLVKKNKTKKPTQIKEE